GAPTAFAKSCSNRRVAGPEVNQPERSTQSTSARSSAPISGRKNGTEREARATAAPAGEKSLMMESVRSNQRETAANGLFSDSSAPVRGRINSPERNPTP